MNRLKLAILEDNKEQLKERKINLEETGLADVVVWATNSEDFLNKVPGQIVDAVVLDIDLANDSLSGLDVAYKIKLPTLFVSGHNPRHLLEIEKLEREFDIPVRHITKPATDAEFKKTATKFLTEVRLLKESSFVILDFRDSKKNKIHVDSIVYLCADKAAGSLSNNKQIFFTDRKPEILIDFSFNKMAELGFNRNQFLTIHRSYVVNEKHIRSVKKQISKIEVLVMNASGEKEIKLLSMSENFKY